MTKSFRWGGSLLIQIGLGAVVAAIAGCSSEPEPIADRGCEVEASAPSTARADAARLWVALVSATRAGRLDDATASEIDARAAALEPAAATRARGCDGLGQASSTLVSEPFRCTDDCRTTSDDLARAIGDAGVARLRALAGSDAVAQAVASGDVDAILAAIGDALGASAVDGALAMVPGLRALAARAGDCRAFRARSCGGAAPGPVRGVSGTWRWTFASHIPSSGGYTPTRGRTEVRVDFDLRVKSADAAGALTLEGPARVDVVDDQGVIQNILVPGGTDCPLSWHVTGPHAFDASARGALDPATGRVTVEPRSFSFTETRSMIDCRAPASEVQIPIAIPFDGCDGVLVGGELHESHEGRHPPTGTLASITVVDRDSDACDLVAR